MSETILRASTPTPNYKLGLAEKNYEAFNIYYGSVTVDRAGKKFGNSLYDTESAIRYVESPNAHIVVDPHGLPERPLQALIWGALGRSTEDAARELHVSPPTAKRQRTDLFTRIGATGLSHAIHIAFKEQIFQPAEFGNKKLSLTPRERETLTALSQGLTKDQAAPALYLTPATVRTHTHHLLTDNKLKNVPHAITLAFLSGDIPLPDKNPPGLSRRVL